MFNVMNQDSWENRRRYNEWENEDQGRLINSCHEWIDGSFEVKTRFPTCSCKTITESVINAFLIFIFYAMITDKTQVLLSQFVALASRMRASPLALSPLCSTLCFTGHLCFLTHCLLWISRGWWLCLGPGAAPRCIDLTSTRLLQLLPYCHSQS